MSTTELNRVVNLVGAEIEELKTVTDKFQEGFKIKCNTDSMTYRNKPTDNLFGGICNRTKNEGSIKELTLMELSEKILMGISFTSAEMKGTKSQDWNSQSLFVVDIDNNNKDFPIITVDECKKILDEYNLNYAFIYYSFSHSDLKPKYRIVCMCNEVVTSPDEAKKMNEGFISLFPQADKQCKNLDRVYYGTNKSLAVEAVRNVTFDKNILLDLYYNNIHKEPEPVQRKESPPPTTSKQASSFDLEQAIAEFDLLDHILQTTSSRVAGERGAEKLLNPCPVCSHKGDFYINTSNKPQNYKCHSASNGSQGNVYQYLIDTQGLKDKSEARDYFKYKILNIDKEQEKKSFKEDKQKRRIEKIKAMENIAKNKEWYYLTEGGLKLKPSVLAECVAEEKKVIYAGGNYYSFMDGVYSYIKQEELKRYIASRLEDTYTPKDVENTKYIINNNVIQDPDSLNNDTTIINIANGLLKVSIDGISVSNHTPKFLNTIQIQAKYDLTSRCPQFFNFLNVAIKKENIPLLQEFCGYLLVPATFAQKAFVLLGKGGCGKSTILRILTHLIGEKNISNIPLQHVNERFKTAELYGKIANFFADLPEKEIDDTGIFKALTGEDTVTAERKGQDPFKFVNKARFLFSCNKLPRSTSDRTDGFYRRLIILPFNEPLPEEQRDLELTKKLLEESDGIFLWALEGLQRLILNKWKFSETEDSKKAITKYKSENNNVIPFVEECCLLSEGEMTTSESVYNAYSNYCNDNGYKPFSSGRFADELENEFKVHKDRKRIDGSTNAKAVFTGIRITPFK